MSRIKKFVNSLSLGTGANESARKYWNFIETDDDTVELTLEGEIRDYHPTSFFTGNPLPGDYIVSSEFEEEWQNVKNSRNLIVRVNSPGGDLFTGMAIRNKLAEYTGNMTIINIGVMASAASLLATLPNAKVQTYTGSIFMIHGVSAFLEGYYNATELKKSLRELETLDKAIAKFYAEKMTIDEDKIKSRLAHETYYVGQEAVDEGLADELLDGEAQIDVEIIEPTNKAESSYLSINGLRATDFTSKKFLNKVDSTKVIVKKIHEKKEEKVMDEKELMEKYGDMIEKIVNESINEHVAKAIADEKARIKEIEDIQDQIGDNEMIFNAKYGENPMSARDLAYTAMKEQKNRAVDYLAEREKQGEDTKDVMPNPVDVADTPENEEQKEISDAMKAYQAMKNMNGGKF